MDVRADGKAAGGEVGPDRGVDGLTDETAAFGRLGPEDRRRLGRMGGALFLAGSAFSFPAGLALDPLPAATSHLLGTGGIVTGVALLLAPWERMPSRWLHTLIVLGIAETAAAVLIFSDDFAFYYVVVAIYAAYMVRDRRVLAAYMSLLLLALLAPIAYDEGNARVQAHHVLVTIPVLSIAAAIVLYLRDSLEERERRYRRFAYEAVALAIRIRGSGRRRTGSAAADELETKLDELAARAEHELEKPG
jgi:hypothetical protein